MQTSLPKKQSKNLDQNSKVWSQKLESKTIDIDKIIKSRIKDNIIPYLEKIDEKKYSLKNDNQSQIETNKENKGKIK